MAIVYTIVNNKGGVGKTTTTYNMAAAAVTKRLRVLICDLDPQNNLTSVTTLEDLPPDVQSMADILSARTSASIAEVAVDGIWAGLSVVPSGGQTLAFVDTELTTAMAGRESRLKSALAAVQDDYDLIFLDCPPAINQLTINALTASTATVLVSQVKKFSVDGLREMLKTIHMVQEHYNPTLKIAGVLINQADPQTVAHKQSWLPDIVACCDAENIPLLEPHIGRRQFIQDAKESSTLLQEWPHPEAPLYAHMYTQLLSTIVKGIN
jgi:chromosome partitioning protein